MGLLRSCTNALWGVCSGTELDAEAAISCPAAAKIGPFPDESARRTRPDDGVPRRQSVLDVLQILGAVAILVPFVWSQRGSLGTDSFAYLSLNLLGSSVLAALAVHEHQWGFLLLEAVWAAVAARGLLELRLAS